MAIAAILSSFKFDANANADADADADVAMCKVPVSDKFVHGMHYTLRQMWPFKIYKWQKCGWNDRIDSRIC